MLSVEIEEFAKKIVENVRDKSIRESRIKNKSLILNLWNKLNKKENIVLETVDNTLFNLFNAIDQEVLDISFVATTGKRVNLSREGLGELGGWYIGEEDGWRSKYSKEKVIDNFSDLNIDDII